MRHLWRFWTEGKKKNFLITGEGDKVASLIDAENKVKAEHPRQTFDFTETRYAGPEDWKKGNAR